MPKGDHRRWGVLAVSTAAQAATSAFFLGLAAVAPELRAYYDLSLPALGALLGAASIGILGTLILWGSATDRFGERPVMVVGLAGAAAFLWIAAGQRDPVVVGALLVAAGAAGASVNAASGRAVLSWFPARRRGFAMAVRQTSVPLGAAVAAVALPLVVGRGGVPAVFAALAGSAAVVAVAVAIWVRDPPVEPAPTVSHRRSGARRARPGPRDVRRPSALAAQRRGGTAGRAAVPRLGVPGGAAAHRARRGARRGRWAAGADPGARGRSAGLAPACGRTGSAAGSARCAWWRW